MIVGIAGIGALLGGVGIWRLSSPGVGTPFKNAQAAQRSSGTTTSVTTSKRQQPGNSGTGGTPGTGGASTSLPEGGTGIGKNGVGNPVTANKSGPTGASTPSTSSSSIVVVVQPQPVLLIPLEVRLE